MAALQEEAVHREDGDLIIFLQLMDLSQILSELRDYADDCINSHAHPDDFHKFSPFTCSSCSCGALRLTVEHHTGSEEWNFRGIIWGECSSCGYLIRLFTFTGEHREKLKEERPECDCGNRVFVSALLERIEGEQGIPGFFDEGVIAGKCTECNRNRTIVFID